jgi:hypothetical protein
MSIADQRLANQRVTINGHRDPAKLVSWLGAVQAQEFGPAKWGLGLRQPAGITDAKIQRAFDAGRILRTHVMRPTWHFVTPADICWMIELTGETVHRRMATYDRQLGLDASIFRRAAKVCERVLRDRNFLTRQELGRHFARAGLPGSSWALGHIALYVEAEGVICSGPRRGKQSTYALIAERAPNAVRLSREEALSELARRYFRSHGPATLRDFVWWSGLSTSDAKRGLEMIRGREMKIDGRSYWTLGDSASARQPRRRLAHLLPVYDEYLVAYRDRDAVPHGPAMVRARARGYVQFQHPIVIAGQVAGTWRAAPKGDGVDVRLAPLRPFNKSESQAVRSEITRYRSFLGAAFPDSVEQVKPD